MIRYNGPILPTQWGRLPADNRDFKVGQPTPDACQVFIYNRERNQFDLFVVEPEDVESIELCDRAEAIQQVTGNYQPFMSDTSLRALQPNIDAVTKSLCLFLNGLDDWHRFNKERQEFSHHHYVFIEIGESQVPQFFGMTLLPVAKLNEEDLERVIAELHKPH